MFDIILLISVMFIAYFGEGVNRFLFILSFIVWSVAGRTERQFTNIDTPSEIFKKASDGEKNGVYGDKSKIKLFILGRCGSLGAINRTDTASGRKVRVAVSGQQIVFDERFAHDFGAADCVLTRGFL